MKKIIICFLIVISLFFYGLICNAEEKSIWKDGKFYEGEEYEKLEREEKTKVKAAAEEFVIALLIKDEKSISELSYYGGFIFEKKEKIFSLINSYHKRPKLSCSGIEVLFIKMEYDKMQKATVGIKAYFSTKDAIGGLSSAPIIQAWKFVYKDKKWLFLFKK